MQSVTDKHVAQEVSEADKRKFIRWEEMSRDSIDVKRAYVHLAGDLATGVLLSQIVYWFLPSRTGDDRVTVERDGKLWLAKQREDWWAECCITPKQFDRCSCELEKRGLIWTAVYRFNGLAVKHASLNWSGLIQQLSEGKSGIDQRVKAELTKGEKRNSPLGKSEIHLWGSSSNTESTTEITAETTTESLALTSPGEVPAAAPPIFITLLLNDKSEYPVTEEMLKQWVPLYPGVDVRQSLRTMCGWLLNNERRRKTRSGIRAFIGNWLARDQKDRKSVV